MARRTARLGFARGQAASVATRQRPVPDLVVARASAPLVLSAANASDQGHGLAGDGQFLVGGHYQHLHLRVGGGHHARLGAALVVGLLI